MAIAQPIHRLTEAEFLELERKAPSKSEFFDGEVFAMAGGTLRHSLIATNLAAEVRDLLKGKQCVPFNSDLRVKVEATGLLTYPDLSVICGTPRFVDAHEDTVLNPTLIAEVLSDSTEAYDRGKKFEHYRQIKSLRGYLLVSQSSARFELFIRQPDKNWSLREAAGLDDSLSIAFLDIVLALRGVYAQVRLEAAPLRLAVSSRKKVR